MEDIKGEGIPFLFTTYKSSFSSLPQSVSKKDPVILNFVPFVEYLRALKISVFKSSW